MKIVIIDGQGGRLGSLLVERVKARLPQAQIHALGTNSAATAAMLKAGADLGATGENPVAREAVGSCRAKKFLIPMNNCGVLVAGVETLPLPAYVSQAVEKLAMELTEN